MMVNHPYKKVAINPSANQTVVLQYIFFVGTLLSCIVARPAYAQHHQGLYFHAHQFPIEQRTSLLLNNGKPYKLTRKDIFTLDFNLDIRTSEAPRFGYIFKLIANEDESYNLVLNTKNELFFVFDDRNQPGREEAYKKIYIGNNEHLKVAITFDRQQNEINLRINDHQITYECDLHALNSLLVNFGKCDIANFKTNDVPPVILREVQVYYHGILTHQWLFDRYRAHTTYDHIHQKEAIFSDGKMLIDNSIRWQRLGVFQAKKAPQITFDSVTNQIFVLDHQHLLTFALAEEKLSQRPTNNNPTDVLVNRLVFDYNSNRLLSYNFSPQRLNYFNDEVGSWGDRIDEAHEYYHHNRHISLKDTSLYLYGGYGHYRYKGFLYKVDLRSGEWETKDLSAHITPRYLAAMGANKAGDKLYILGGKGAEGGLQELSPKIFFDLHEIDLKTLTPRLLYKNGNESQEHFLFSNNLIVDDSTTFIYTLAFPAEKTGPSYIQLKRISVDDGTITNYADTIPFTFRDDLSYCDLFYSPSLQKLIAVTAASKDGINSDVSVYSLNFPPLQRSDIFKAPTNKSSSKTMVVIVFIVLVAGGIFLYRRKAKKPSPFHPSGVSPTTPQPDSIALADTTSVANAISLESSFIPPSYYQLEKSSIRLLGAFQVFDKEGREMTENFSPILKQLLILLLLYTFKHKRGISSSKLEEILWFGKSERSALNNRNVNLSKLRALLEDFGQVEISNSHGYWSISLPEEALSDYGEILELCSQLEDNPKAEVEKVYRLVELLSFGELLPEIQLEWIDGFKSDFAAMVIDTLLFIVKAEIVTIQKDATTILKISDIILTFDPVNEDAIKVKCKTLYAIGKKTLAKSAFEHFTKRHYSLLDEEFPGTLKDIIE